MTSEKKLGLEPKRKKKEIINKQINKQINKIR